MDIWNVGFTIYVLFFNNIPNANKIYWNTDRNLISSPIIVKEVFISTLSLYPSERKPLDKIIELEYFN